MPHNIRMTSWVPIAVLAASSPWSGNFIQGWVPQGSIESRQYQNQIREGNRVVATEFFHLEYSVEILIEETRKDTLLLICQNICKGKKHKDHSVCDTSCDDRCTDSHRHTIKGKYTPNTDQMREATSQANQLAIDGGGTVSPSDWSHRVSQALADFRREARKQKTFNMPHAGACSARIWEVGTKHFTFKVRGKMRKVGYIMSQGVRTPIDAVIGTHMQTVAEADIAQEEPFDKHESANCRCKLVEKPQEEANQIWQDEISDLQEWFEEFINGLDDEDWFDGATFDELLPFTDSTGVLVQDEQGKTCPDSSDVSIECTGSNLSEGFIGITNNCDEERTVIVPCGTVAECEDKSTQNMCTITRAQVPLPPGATVWVMINGGEVRTMTAPIPVRWACLQMSKKEPGPNSKFKLKRNRDSGVARLSRLSEKARIRGPWDQARVWIYTDHATLDEVNKRLIPGISATRYIGLLYDVARACGVDFGTNQYNRCLDPSLLGSVAIQADALTWVVNAIADIKPRDLSSWLSANAAKVAMLATSDTQYGPTHVATIARITGEQNNPDLRKAGIKLLQSVPESARSAVAQAGGLDGLRMILAERDAAQSGLALDALVGYPRESFKDMLSAAYEALPNDSLRSKAAALLGGAP